jgi:acyl-CoA thioesterase-1
LFVVLCGLIATLSWGAASAQIVAFGAGNISGWNVAATDAMPARLQAMLNANGYRVRVVNAGIFNNTTADMRNRLDTDIPSGTKLVILDMGGDLFNESQKGIGPEQTNANLQAIQARLNARGIAIIPVSTNDVPAIYRQRDGRHLTPEGHKYVAAQLLPMVMARLGPAPTLAPPSSPTSADLRAACGADARRLCSDVLRDDDKRRACMHDHRAELSKDCLAAIAKSRQGD